MHRRVDELDPLGRAPSPRLLRRVALAEGRRVRVEPVATRHSPSRTRSGFPRPSSGPASTPVKNSDVQRTPDEQRLREVRQRALFLMGTLGKQELREPLQALGWTFAFDNAKRRLGLCTYSKGKKTVKRISVSKHYTVLNGLSHRDEHGLQVLEDVIRHEIAHAIQYEQDGTSNHGRTWKAICKRVGADPSRLYEGEVVARVPGRYVGRCPNCGHEEEYYRLPKNPRACSACCADHNGGRYAARFKLVLTDRQMGKDVRFGAEKASGKAIWRQTSEKSPEEQGYKYIGECPNCGRQTGYRRKLKRARACGACCEKYAGGKYDEEYKLEITQNY